MDRAVPTRCDHRSQSFNITDPPRAVNFARNTRILDQMLSIFAVEKLEDEPHSCSISPRRKVVDGPFWKMPAGDKVGLRNRLRREHG